MGSSCRALLVVGIAIMQIRPLLAGRSKDGQFPVYINNCFYVYGEQQLEYNKSYIPAGWMGDYGDLRINNRYVLDPSSGTKCMQIRYSAKGSIKANYAGIYWVTWSTQSDFVWPGFNLNNASELKFFARGEKGREAIKEFKVGGAKGEYPDTCEVGIGPITLTKDWKEYEIMLTDKDLSEISSPFAWSAEKKDNPDGITFYLDEIRYEK